MRPSTLGLWMAMAAIDPWDDNRADWRAAEIAAATLVAQGVKKKSGEDVTARDFMRFHTLQEDPDRAEADRQRELHAQIRTVLMNASGHKATQ